MALAVGGECQMAEERQSRLHGLNDTKIVRFTYVPIVRPVAHCKKTNKLKFKFVEQKIQRQNDCGLLRLKKSNV